MSAPQSLLQAAVNRLAARLGSGLADTAASLAGLAQDAPGRFQQELSLFWEEVEQEAVRLEGRGAGDGPGSHPGAAAAGFRGPQDQIDDLRARVAALSRRLEQRPQGRG
ncbi:MAG TPA: hypothetical protein VER57_00815 [Cyanobium sp.]|nr:hypothetical protein [Cyanobium sp.]